MSTEDCMHRPNYYAAGRIVSGPPRAGRAEVTDAGKEALRHAATRTRLTKLEMTLAYLGGAGEGRTLAATEQDDGTWTIKGVAGYGGPLPDALIEWGDQHLSRLTFWPRGGGE